MTPAPPIPIIKTVTTPELGPDCHQGVLGLFPVEGSLDLQEKNHRLLQRLTALGLEPQGVRRADVRRLAPRVDVETLSGGYWMPSVAWKLVRNEGLDTLKCNTDVTQLFLGDDPVAAPDPPLVLLHGDRWIAHAPTASGSLLLGMGCGGREALLREACRWMPVLNVLPLVDDTHGRTTTLILPEGWMPVWSLR
jgi:hypothetical protein